MNDERKSGLLLFGFGIALTVLLYLSTETEKTYEEMGEKQTTLYIINGIVIAGAGIVCMVIGINHIVKNQDSLQLDGSVSQK